MRLQLCLFRVLPRTQGGLWSRVPVKYVKPSEAAVTYGVQSRGFYYGGRNDPFSQMEAFRKDMEKKFAPFFENRGPWPFDPRIPVRPTPPPPPFGTQSDISTNDRFILAFHFQNAKSEDISVSLKDRSLTVKAKLEETSAFSRTEQDVSHTYEVPEDVNVEALVSSLSIDGILTVEAPKEVSQEAGPTVININRE